MDRPSRISPLVKQIWIGSGVLMTLFAMGMMLGYPSSMLTALRAPDSAIKVDLEQVSWIASTDGFAAIIGFLISSVTIEVIGRKMTFAINNLIVILGLIITYFANDVPTLLLSRFFGGFATGGNTIPASIILGEYSDPKYRSTFLYLKTVLVFTGSMVVHILGHYFHWRNVCLMITFPFILGVFNTFTWPESPFWYASKRRYDECEKVFLWLRGNDEQSTRELEKIIKAQKERFCNVRRLSFCAKVKGFFMKFALKEFVKPLVIAFFCFLLLEACGRHAFPPYALQIINTFTDTESQSFYYTFSIDFMIVISGCFSTVFIKLFKIRTILFSSGFLALFVLINICVYIFLVSQNILSRDRSWIPVILLAVFFILTNLGCTLVPFVIIGEIFPLAHKGAGSAVAGVMMSGLYTLVLKVFPVLLESIKLHGIFTVFSILMGISLVVLYFILPETKNRTLQDIEEYFKYGKFRDDDQNFETNAMIIK